MRVGASGKQTGDRLTDGASLAWLGKGETLRAYDRGGGDNTRASLVSATPGDPGVSMNAQQESVIPFVRRHIGPDHAEQRRMLEEVGYSAVGELLEAAIPESIRLQRPLELPTPMSEEAATAELRALASANRQMRQMIGMGYYGTHTPAVNPS